MICKFIDPIACNHNLWPNTTTLCAHPCLLSLSHLFAKCFIPRSQGEPLLVVRCCIVFTCLKSHSAVRWYSLQNYFPIIFLLTDMIPPSFNLPCWLIYRITTDLGIYKVVHLVGNHMHLGKWLGLCNCRRVRAHSD